MTATLTDRYIAATVRSLPADLQIEVRDELDASIADAISARAEQGETHEAAERTVLTELGDPGILAAGYADRPLHLIGPRYYLTWWRLLKLLWAIVPVTAGAGVAIGGMVADDPVGTIIGSVISVIIGAIVHVAFWTTIVFMVLERTGADTGLRWTVDSLPEAQETGAGRGDLIASLVMAGVIAGALFWDQFIGFVLVAQGEVDVASGLGAQTSAIAILDPALWPWGIGFALLLLAAEAAIAIAVYARGRWTTPLALLNSVIAVAFAAAALYLLVSGQLFNPLFLEFTLGRADVPDNVGAILAIVLSFVVLGVATWDIIDGWLKARRARHAS